MQVTVQGGEARIAELIEFEPGDRFMCLERFVELNIDEYPWLHDADEYTIVPDGSLIVIELSDTNGSDLRC